jgi:hypothetical protein
LVEAVGFQLEEDVSSEDTARPIAATKVSAFPRDIAETADACLVDIGKP